MRLIKQYKGYFIREKSNNAYYVFSNICQQNFDPLKSKEECEVFINNLIAKKDVDVS